MNIEAEFPGVSNQNARDLAENVVFFMDGYDIKVTRIAARGPNVFLGNKPCVCRFCGRQEPEAKFRKEAHALAELVGNGTLLSHYECDDCNDRFKLFEDDLGKLTLLARIAGQVLGKNGVPSAKTNQKKSRIDLKASGFVIEEHVDDPIAEIDYENQQYTLTLGGQRYRPLGVYKALLKFAVTLMDAADLAIVPEALKWLRSADLTTDRIDDGLKYACFRSFTPGPAPFANTTAILLRRKSSEVAGPALMFVLGFGNLGFQIVVPTPQIEKHNIGKQMVMRAVPMLGFVSPDRVRGPTKYWPVNLGSTEPELAPGSFTMHFDNIKENPA